MSGDDEKSRKTAGSPPCVQPKLPPMSSTYSRILANHPRNQQMVSQNLRTGINLERPSLARSLSQPLPFALDSLYHAANEQQQGESSYSLLQPSPFAPSGSCLGLGADFQAHRRSNSEVIPFQPSGTLPWNIPGASNMPVHVVNTPVHVVNAEPICARKGVNNNTEMMGDQGKSVMVNVDEDVFSTYMDLDYLDATNPSGSAGKCGNEVQDTLDCQDKVNGVDECEADIETSSGADDCWRGNFKRPAGVSSLPEMCEGLNRVAVGDVSQMNLHLRSVSEGDFMENTNLSDDFLDIPSYPGTAMPGQLLSQIISTSSESNDPNATGVVLGGVAFTGADLSKIMANQKLSEIAVKDPRRAKRILSNRKSAARSKERKMRYVAELEHRIMTLQNETTMLAAQLSQLEHDCSALTSQNNELRLRLQALEQQAHLQEALKAALTDELQRLKLANEASSKVHQCEILQLSKKKETDGKPPKQPQQSNDKATTSADHESKQ